MHRMLTLLLLLPGPVFAAEFACSPSATEKAPAAEQGSIRELDEITVTGARSIARARDLATWLKLLEGQYRYEGSVDICGAGNTVEQRPVTGKADCASLYENSTPLSHSLYCKIDVRWASVLGESGTPIPGSQSSLSPAVVVYGLAPDLPGIQFMQIDNKGLATHAKGRVSRDTLTTREPCSLAPSCQKVSRITAQADSTNIVMLIDFEVGTRRVLRQAFLLHRVSDIKMTRSGERFLTENELLRVGER
jgi:hypothetical protein